MSFEQLFHDDLIAFFGNIQRCAFSKFRVRIRVLR
jgi:hypothetical protein